MNHHMMDLYSNLMDIHNNFLKTGLSTFNIIFAIIIMTTDSIIMPTLLFNNLLFVILPFLSFLEHHTTLFLHFTYYI